MLDVPRDTRLQHTLSVLRGVVVLRLHRGSKNTAADAPGITLRLMLLICVPMAAIVAIVALLAIYLGPIGVGTLLTGGAGDGYGIKRFLVRRRRRRSRSKT